MIIRCGVFISFLMLLFGCATAGHGGAKVREIRSANVYPDGGSILVSAVTVSGEDLVVLFDASLDGSNDVSPIVSINGIAMGYRDDAVSRAVESLREWTKINKGGCDNKALDRGGAIDGACQKYFSVFALLEAIESLKKGANRK